MLEVNVLSEEEADKKIEQFIDVFIEEIALTLRREMRSNIDFLGITDLGFLKNSVHVYPVGDDFVVKVEADYASAVNDGTFPHWAPIKPLLGWARRKLGEEKAAYAVRAKIAKKGTEPKPFVDPAIEVCFEFAFNNAVRRVF